MKSIGTLILCTLAALSVNAADWGSIRILTELSEPGKTLGVSIETTHLRVIQKNAERQNGDDFQFGFSTLVDRINGRSNQVATGIIDGAPGAKGQPMTSIEMLSDNAQSISFRVHYTDGRRWVYTYYPESPVIRVDYTNWNWSKAFQDFCTPGGKTTGNQPVIVGSQNWVRAIIDMSEGVYYDRSRDGASGGSLNQRGWMIFGIYNPLNGNGYCRVFPFDKLSSVKLMYDIGIEAFFTGNPVTGYLFPFSKGEVEMVSIAQEIITRHIAGRSMAIMGAPTPTANLAPSVPAGTKAVSVQTGSAYTITLNGKRAGSTLSPGIYLGESLNRGRILLGSQRH